MTTLQTFCLEVISPEEPEDEWLRSDQRVLSNLPALIEEVEENMTDLLPEGYSVKILEDKESRSE